MKWEKEEMEMYDKNKWMWSVECYMKYMYSFPWNTSRYGGEAVGKQNCVKNI